MSDLLPPNATPQERALSETVARISNVPTPARQLWNAQTCPFELLPWLAWAFSVDDWNAEWTEQQKRDVIANSFTVHSTKGTVGAVKASLAALGYQVTLIEWWQDPENMDPYTFLIEINTDGQPLTSTIYAEALQLVDRSKNTRSHLARTRVVTKNKAQVYAGATTLQGAVFEVFDNSVLDILDATNNWYEMMNFTVPGRLG